MGARTVLESDGGMAWAMLNLCSPVARGSLMSGPQVFCAQKGKGQRYVTHSIIRLHLRTYSI